ncbi:hypothetical protein L6452_34224 [Arctium lappa]|uniref:Uncharacterized protein n=1 Tax=Arctium lappa TaxID=4217 RepID=A0ACB8YI66_ARCLA|nr:hypothetical protein L6452_34224 [Arctium lappa]
MDVGAYNVPPTPFLTTKTPLNQTEQSQAGKRNGEHINTHTHTHTKTCLSKSNTHTHSKTLFQRERERSALTILSFMTAQAL